jgi:polyhydroxyalkanoate synthesis regulator phasin
MAEMAERAQAISQEAGTKIASAMRDVINTAAGVAGFAVESVRDLVQYMVRRGQMTQDEADRLIREAEDARGKRTPKSETRSTTEASAPKEAAPRPAAKTAKKAAAKPSAAASEKKPAAKKATAPKKRR